VGFPHPAHRARVHVEREERRGPLAHHQAARAAPNPAAAAAAVVAAFAAAAGFAVGRFAAEDAGLVREVQRVKRQLEGHGAAANALAAAAVNAFAAAVNAFAAAAVPGPDPVQGAVEARNDQNAVACF
jgi:hypothetical protein